MVQVGDQGVPVIRAAYQRGLETAKAKYVRDAVLAESYAVGPLHAMAAIPWAQIAAEVARTVHAGLWEVVTRGFRAEAETHGATVAQKQFRLGAGVFDLTNQATIRWARDHAARLVQGLTDESQVAIRRIIVDMFARGIPPQTAARMIRHLIGLTDVQAGAWLRLRTQLAADVADAANPMTQARMDKLLARRRQQMLADRAETIARTEAQNAANRGQEAVWRQAVSQGFLDPNQTRRKWLTSRDERLCAICEPIPARGPVGLDEPFTDGDGNLVAGPPAHPNCRCSQALVFTS